MSSSGFARGEQQRQQMAEALQSRRQGKPGQSAVQPRDEGGEPPRVKPFRMTVDLAPELYRSLQDWLNAQRPVRPKVTEVMRALLAELLVSEDLQRRISARLRETR